MRTMQRGMGGVPAEAFRYSVGDMPTRSRKRELNEPTLWNPTRKQISVISWLIARTGLDVDSIKPPAGGVPLAGTPVSWLRLENRRWLLVWHYDRRHTNTCGSESRAEVPAEANRCTCNPNIPKSTRSATRPYQREIAEVIAHSCTCQRPQRLRISRFSRHGPRGRPAALEHAERFAGADRKSGCSACLQSLHAFVELS